tara:strand:- start:396 stop:581 length:186 start_codon:yes stop_codon:yes gene_type:complete
MALYEPKKGSAGHAAFNKIMRNEKLYPDNYDRYISALQADSKALRAAAKKPKPKPKPKPKR